MAVTLTTLESNLQTKLNATSGTTDAQEFLLLSKSVEALTPSIAVQSVIDEGTTQVAAVTAEGTTQVGLVTSEGTTQVAAVQAAVSGYATQADIDAAVSGYTTQADIDTSVSALVDSSPATLDTLNELAAALGDDANFSTTVTNSIATKLPLAGGTLTGALAATDITLSGTIGGSYTNLHPEVTTTSASASQTIDITKPMHHTTMTAATAFSGVSIAAGRTSMMVLDTSATPHTPTWSTDIKWPGATEPTWADSRYWIVSFTCLDGAIILASASGYTV